jgi:two-component system sensor histidine kinase/response regulator
MAETFDEAELMSRIDNDVVFLGETVEMIAADGPVLLEQVRAAVLTGDGPGVGRHAHALKGMISNFCAPQVQACAYELEKLGRSGDVSGAGPLVERMAERLSALTAELQGFVKARV